MTHFNSKETFALQLFAFTADSENYDTAMENLQSIVELYDTAMENLQSIVELTECLIREHFLKRQDNLSEDAKTFIRKWRAFLQNEF